MSFFQFVTNVITFHMEYSFTMLQKVLKCEVKAWLWWNFIILLPLRFFFYVKSNFGKLKKSKKVIFGNFRDTETWNLVNLLIESCSILLKSKFRTSYIAKITFSGRLNSPKFDFTSNLSGGKMIKFQQSQALTSHFQSFWSIVNFWLMWQLFIRNIIYDL